jgi:large subunit ribosomal protein L3
VTVVEISPNVVTQIRSVEVDGYTAVQIAYGAIDPRKANKPATGHFEKAGVTPRRHLTEVRTADAAEYSLGQELAVDIFEPASSSTSSHEQGQGLRRCHEAPQLQGRLRLARFAPQPPQARIDRCVLDAQPRLQGHAMAGRMGGERVTVQGLKVTRSTSRRASSWSRVPSPALAAASSSSATL